QTARSGLRSRRRGDPTLHRPSPKTPQALRRRSRGDRTAVDGFNVRRDQYSPLILKYEPRIVPASFDFCLANLKEPSSAGTSMPSESLKPTARFVGSSSGYRTLIESPFS